MVIIALGPSSTSTHVIQVIVVAECGSELSQIWTVSDGIPNPDLKVSGELSAMCSTEQAVTERGVSFAGAPPRQPEQSATTSSAPQRPRNRASAESSFRSSHGATDTTSGRFEGPGTSMGGADADRSSTELKRRLAIDGCESAAEAVSVLRRLITPTNREPDRYAPSGQFDLVAVELSGRRPRKVFGSPW